MSMISSLLPQVFPCCCGKSFTSNMNTLVKYCNRALAFSYLLVVMIDWSDESTTKPGYRFYRSAFVDMSPNRCGFVLVSKAIFELLIGPFTSFRAWYFYHFCIPREICALYVLPGQFIYYIFPLWSLFHYFSSVVILHQWLASKWHAPVSVVS